MRNRYLLWDHDGVLVDTEQWYFEAPRQVLARVAIELSKPHCVEIMTRSRSCWDLVRAQGIPEGEIKVRRAARDGLYREFLRSKPIEMDGVGEILEELAPAVPRLLAGQTTRAERIEVG